jgi:nucleotide-binding universal stress UspA family protein
MNPERILLPLDIRKCPLEVFFAANGLANHPGATVILLHVVTLNIGVPEKGVYEALARDAHWHLKRLARGCLRPEIATVTRVRFGKPAVEILAEAAASNADLIILPSYPPSLFHRLFGPILPRTVERVIREAPCGVFLTSASSRFNCEKTWGRLGRESDTALSHLVRTPESQPSAVSLAEGAFAAAEGERRAAA